MRCNIGINPKYLTDQHLVAEYRELPMVFGSLRLNNFQIKSEIPSVFTLGTGHMNFFKNKFKYLKRRWDSLVEEMKNRGFQTNMKFPDFEFLEEKFKQDWVPNEMDFKIIHDRILQKLNMKPDWYRINGKKIDSNFFDTYNNIKLDINY